MAGRMILTKDGVLKTPTRVEPKVDPQLAGWTSPSDIPQNVAKKILKARQALLESNIDEAYNALYSIADPEFSDPFPWRILEKKSNGKDHKRERRKL